MVRRLLIVLAAVCGCGSVPTPEPGAGSPPELGSSLNVRVLSDSVRLELHVTNVTTGPIVLEYMTTQRYDFEVTHPGGTSVWRWSEGRAFGEAVGREVLQSGETRQYAATWSANGVSGDFVATARLVSTTYPVELRTVFQMAAAP